MKDWSRQGRNELGPSNGISGASRDGAQTEAAAPQQAWGGQSRDAVERAEASAKRHRMGIAAIAVGGVMMVLGAAIVAVAAL